MYRISFYIVIICLAICFTLCNSRSNRFVNHRKWMLNYTLNGATLKSNPVSVSERNYRNLNDTVFTDTLTGMLKDSWIHSFNKEGDLVSVKGFLDSSFYFHTFYNITDDGEQYEYYNYSNGDTTKRFIKSKKIGEGKYKRDNYNSDQLRYSEIWTFTDDGQKITRERYFNDTLSFTVNEFYEKGRLKKITQNEESGFSENLFYYARNGFLDSEASFVNKIPLTKYTYVNNEYGDPVYYERSGSNGVEQRRWMKYQYDDKGNWIKKIEKSEDKWTDLGIVDTLQKFPGYHLTVREIKY